MSVLLLGRVTLDVRDGGQGILVRASRQPSTLSEETMASDVSRRNFLLMCAVASGAPLAGLDPGPVAAADTPKKGGTLRAGFYIAAATMDPHLSGSNTDRQVYHNIH